MRRGNGDGSIFKLSGKRRKPFAVRITTGWTNEGKQKYAYLGYYKTKTEAKKALTEYLVKPYNLESTKVSMMDIYYKWEEQHKLSEGTYKAYSGLWKRCTNLHKKAIKEVTLVDLENEMQDFTPAIKKVYRNLMKNLYKYACRHEFTDKNLAELIEIDKIVSKQREVFTKEDIEKLWENYGKHPLSDIPLILLYTGMRINELLGMKSKDVYIEKRMMIGGSKTDAGKNRQIPIHKDILPLIEKRLGNEYLITGSNDKKLSYPSYRQTGWQDTVVKVIGKKYTPHETRHTFITQAVKCGMSKVIVQKIVGHSAKDVTDHYTHNDFSELLEEMNKFCIL